MTGLERVFRDAWAAVVASTARLTRDLDLAEDCAQEAVERALRAWPRDPPDNPAGWLTTTAHRIALDRLRREATLRRKLPLLVEPPGERDEPVDPLRLVFTCCHPALARESQVALTLRLLCGLDVAAIAAVLLTGEAGVARRITRAKQKIAAARIPFRVPPDEELPARLDTVLTVVHLVHTAGHLRDPDLTGRARGLREIDDLALDGYPYLPAARADVLARLGRGEDAAAAYGEALALTTNPVERRYLTHKLTGRGDP